MEGFNSVKLFITLLNEPVDKKCYIPPIIPYPAMAGSAWPNIGPCGAHYVNWMWWNVTFQLSRIHAGFEGDRSTMDKSLPSYRMFK